MPVELGDVWVECFVCFFVHVDVVEDELLHWVDCVG